LKISKLTEIPGEPRSSFGHVILNGDLFIIGGHPGKFHKYDKANFSSEVHAYNIANNSWRKCASFPRPTQGLRVVESDGYLYAFGGFSYEATIAINPWPAKSLDSVYRYSPKDDKWEQISVMPRPRSSHVCEVINGKAYLIGGWNGTPSAIGVTKGEFVTAIDVFDLTKEIFLPSCLEFNFLRKRRAFSSVIYNGKITVAGGLGFEGYMNSDLFSDVISFDFPSNECEAIAGQSSGFKQGDWSLLPQLPLPLFSPGMGVVNGELLVAGGLGPVLPPHNGMSRNQILKLNKSKGFWEELPVCLSEKKSFVEVEEIGQDCAAFIGGHRGFESDSLPSNLIEILTP
jgi:hypothetical protein